MATKKLNERTCQCCGKKVWDRIETLTDLHIRTLYDVFKWAHRNRQSLKTSVTHPNRVYFNREKIKGILKTVAGSSESMTANFAKIRHDDSVLTNPTGKRGDYALDLDKTARFFAGDLPIPAQFRIHAQWQHQPRKVTVEKHCYVGDFPKFKTFFEDKQFVAQYLNPYTRKPDPELSGQGGLF